MRMIMLGSRDRFKEAPWYNPDQKVTIGGLGSIGSWLTLFMGKVVNTIYVYEHDSIENHNLSGQFYGKEDVGDTKASSTKMHAMNFNPETNIISRGKFEEESGVTPICFAGFDNMEARKNMFDSWKKLDNRELFIEASLTAEELWVYAVTPEKEDKYESERLISDDDIAELPCSFKSTTHISAMVASYMTIMFTNYSHIKQIEDIRNLPYETRFQAPMVLQMTNYD